MLSLRWGVESDPVQVISEEDSSADTENDLNMSYGSSSSCHVFSNTHCFVNFDFNYFFVWLLGNKSSVDCAPSMDDLRRQGLPS